MADDTPTTDPTDPGDRKARVRRNVQALVAKGATKEQVARYLDSERAKSAKLAHTPTGEESTLTGVARGLTFDFADEALGGIDAASKTLPPALGGESAPLSDFGKNYHTARDKVRDFEKRAEIAHPKTTTASQLAGGLAPVVLTGGASEGGGLLKALLGGAKYGAIQGAGSAKELSDVPGEAATGAGFGAAFGGLLHYGGQALAGGSRAIGATDWLGRQATKAGEKLGGGKLGDIFTNVGQSIGNTGKANARLNRGLADEGSDALQLSQSVRGNVATSGDKPEMLADYSPELLKTTAGVSKRPGPGRARINQSIKERAAATRPRVLSDLGGGAAPDNIRPALEGQIRERSAQASALSSRYAGQQIDDPVISEILSRPTFKSLWEDAQTLAANEGRDLPTKTTYQVPPQFQASIDREPPEDHDRIIQKLVDAGLAKQIQVPAPDVESIAYVKRALDDRIRGGFDGTKSTGKNLAASLTDGYNQIRSRVAELSPEYDDFLTDYAARSAPIDAGVTGLNASKYTNPTASAIPKQALGAGDPRALKTTLTGVSGLERAASNMGDTELPMFRGGLKTNLLERAERVPALKGGSTTSVLKSVFPDSPSATRVRSLGFDTPDDAAVFEHALGRERTMAATNDIAGGSPTTELRNESSTAAPNMLSTLAHPINSLRSMLAAGDEIANKKTAAILGQRLGATGADGMQSVLADMLRQRVGGPLIEQTGNALRNTLIPQLPFVGAPQ